MGNIKLGNINLLKCKENRDSNIFGDIDLDWIDLKISKSLLLNNKVIGGYLLKESSMLPNIETLKKLNNNGDIENLKIHITNKELEIFKNKIGIFSNFIYIDKRYRNKNLSKYLIDYSLTKGDYIWGISDITTSDFWKKHNRIIIASYTEELGESILTSTKI
jgi:hypothetical protein